MSDWLFDLGNTRLKCAPLHADGGHGEVRAIAHGGAFDALRDALPAQGGVAYVASVAPEPLRLDLLQALSARFQRIALARTQRACAGLEIAYTQPRRLGVDRFLAMLGARALGGPALVVGVGTALTIDLVDANGRHLGGRIAPSPALMRAALHARAAQLPAAGGAYMEFADDTDAALASGCEGAALALVERSQAQASARLHADARVLLHGGGAADLHVLLPAATHLPWLVLDGLARWAQAERPA